jgi:nucleotide-binding universal stress UspA family protein
MEPTIPQAASPDSVPVLLVATDFSQTADAALEWASELARLQGARLELIHAVTVPPSFDLDAVPGMPAGPGYGFVEEVQEKALARLGQAAVGLRDRGTHVSTHLGVGVPSAAIVQRAEEVKAAGIVMGTRGLTGLRHLLLGSTTERVIHRASCPVLTIHPSDVGRHRPIRTILVPTDFSQDAELAITAAHRLLAPVDRDARMILVHAFNLPIEYTAYGAIPTSIRYLEDAGLESERLLEEMRQRLLREGLEVETVAREGDPALVVAEEAERGGADLIAMGTHGRSALRQLLMGSTAERVLQHAPCPVMTIRRPEERAS